MRHHLNRNKTWVIIGLIQVWVGYVTIMRTQQLDTHLPSMFGLFDDMPIGILYLIVGVLLLVNSIWDFYWYGIRVILIVMSTMMFTFLSTSYVFNDILHGGPTFPSGVFFVLTLDVLWEASQEPPHKLWKGRDLMNGPRNT